MRILQPISLAVCLFFIATVQAQVLKSSSPVQSSRSANASDEQATNYQLKVQVRRVVVDVVVTDANGSPVQGLKQDDFKVKEDGAIQPIHFFDVHNGATEKSPQQALHLDLHLPANTFSNLALAPADKPVTVLLYDMLDTPQASLPSAHRAIVKFIEDQKSSSRIAIFVLSDRLHLVQGFTDDETQLMRAVNSKGATLKAPPLRVHPVGDSDIEDELLTNAELEEMMYLGIKRNRITVDAFIEIARYVSALPGRKNLIWMSGSFPPEIFSNNISNAGSQWQVVIDPRVRAAKKLLDESRVAVYPVDVRGLQVDPQYSAASAGTVYIGPMRPVNSFGSILRAEHAAMDVIADSTGGRAFYNTNGLKEAMDAAVRQGSEYYTLTYAPSNTKQDGGERNIRVTLKHPGYQLSYRRSYLADDARNPAPALPLALDRSMQHGAPNSSQLFFEAKVDPVGVATPASIEEIKNIQTVLHAGTGKTANGAGSAASPWLNLRRRDTLKVQHYDIDFAILGRQLDMPPTPEGGYASDMRFALAAYTEDGDVLNEVEVSVKNTISPAQHQKIESDGYHASMTFLVPEGAVSLRIAVRDEIGKRIGTMEIPLPITAPKSTATPTPAT